MLPSEHPQCWQLDKQYSEVQGFLHSYWFLQHIKIFSQSWFRQVMYKRHKKLTAHVVTWVLRSVADSCSDLLGNVHRNLCLGTPTGNTMIKKNGANIITAQLTYWFLIVPLFTLLSACKKRPKHFTSTTITWLCAQGLITVIPTIQRLQD